MTQRDISRAIEPGSIPQGGRQEFEGNLSAALGAEGGAPPSQGGPAPALPTPGGTMESLLGGAIPGDDLPVTDGLSVGAGAGGPTSDPMLSDTAGKLRLIAQGAVSPYLRFQARAELRRMAGGEPV